MFVLGRVLVAKLAVLGLSWAFTSGRGLVFGASVCGFGSLLEFVLAVLGALGNRVGGLGLFLVPVLAV